MFCETASSEGMGFMVGRLEGLDELDGPDGLLVPERHPGVHSGSHAGLHPG